MLSKKLRNFFQIVLIIFGVISLVLTLFLQFNAGKIAETQNSTNKILTINQTRINLEIAQTEAEMSRGLSGRKNLSQNSGMLFVYEKNNIPMFWMKDMNFALDIIWLNENKMVVGIEKNVLPNTFPQTFSPQSEIKYVLEINSGLADQWQIKIGDKAAF
ncbi:MAG: DUF192 domain-containing protein [Patescibacteria group bacterium]